MKKIKTLPPLELKGNNQRIHDRKQIPEMQLVASKYPGFEKCKSQKKMSQMTQMVKNQFHGEIQGQTLNNFQFSDKRKNRSVESCLKESSQLFYKTPGLVPTKIDPKFRETYSQFKSMNIVRNNSNYSNQEYESIANVEILNEKIEIREKIKRIEAVKIHIQYALQMTKSGVRYLHADNNSEIDNEQQAEELLNNLQTFDQFEVPKIHGFCKIEEVDEKDQ